MHSSGCESLGLCEKIQDPALCAEGAASEDEVKRCTACGKYPDCNIPGGLSLLETAP